LFSSTRPIFNNLEPVIDLFWYLAAFRFHLLATCLETLSTFVLIYCFGLRIFHIKPAHPVSKCATFHLISPVAGRKQHRQ
jgi:hypothetical protein